MSHDSGSIIVEARAAYRAGLCILPVASDGTKRPAVSSWTKYQTSRPTAAQMRAFRFARRHGFGMVAGSVSGRQGVMAVAGDARAAVPGACRIRPRHARDER